MKKAKRELFKMRDWGHNVAIRLEPYFFRNWITKVTAGYSFDVIPLFNFHRRKIIWEYPTFTFIFNHLFYAKKQAEACIGYLTIFRRNIIRILDKKKKLSEDKSSVQTLIWSYTRTSKQFWSWVLKIKNSKN